MFKLGEGEIRSTLDWDRCSTSISISFHSFPVFIEHLMDTLYRTIDTEYFISLLFVIKGRCGYAEESFHREAGYFWSTSNGSTHLKHFRSYFISNLIILIRLFQDNLGSCNEVTTMNHFFNKICTIAINKLSDFVLVGSICDQLLSWFFKLWLIF